MVLTREELLQQLSEVVTGTDDTSLKFIEDVTDTVDSLINNSSGVPEEEVTNRINDVEEKWRKKYRDRFFNGNDGNDSNDDNDDVKTYDDLFEVK